MQSSFPWKLALGVIGGVVLLVGGVGGVAVALAVRESRENKAIAQPQEDRSPVKEMGAAEFNRKCRAGLQAEREMVGRYYLVTGRVRRTGREGNSPVVVITQPPDVADTVCHLLSEDGAASLAVGDTVTILGRYRELRYNTDAHMDRCEVRSR